MSSLPTPSPSCSRSSGKATTPLKVQGGLAPGVLPVNSLGPRAPRQALDTDPFILCPYERWVEGLTGVSAGMRQGNDVGTTYRSAIYTYSPEHLEQAQASREQYQKVMLLLYC